MAKLADIASDLWREELNEDSSTSVAAITQWLRTHVGDLNNLTNQGFYINSSYEILDEGGNEIDNDSVSIYRKLYEIYWLKKQSKLFLGANGIDVINSITQDGISIKSLNRNDQSKSYTELYKEAKNELKTLLNNFKFNRAISLDVTGDDALSCLNE